MSSSAPAGGMSTKLKNLEAKLFAKRMPGEGLPDLAKLEREVKDLSAVYERGGLADDAGKMLGGCWMKLARLAVASGFSDEAIEKAHRYLMSAKKLHGRLLAKAKDNADASRRLAVNLMALADLLESRGMPGDHHAAFALHQEGVALREAVLRKQPDSVDAAREVVFGLNKLADFLFRRRQPEAMDQALACYHRDLEVSEQMYKHHGDKSGVARDVAFSANKLGDFYAKRGESGDEDRAVAQYRRALEVCEATLKANPESNGARRDVSVALSKLSGALHKRKDIDDREEALSRMERVVELRRKTLDTEAKNPLAAADLSHALKALAVGVAERKGKGDEERSLELFRQHLELQEQLMAANPNSLDAARDAAVALERYGDLCFRKRNAASLQVAIEHSERALAIRERVLRVDPNSLRAAAEMTVSLVKTSAQLKRRGKEGDYARALKLQELNVELNERLYAAHPGAVKVARHLSDSLEMLAASYQQRSAKGDTQKALAHRKRRAEIMALWLKDEAAGSGTTDRLGHGLVNIASDLLELSGPEALQEALDYSEQAVKINERRCKVEKNSEESVRELAASLGALADCLEKRLEPEDEERLLAIRRRSVEMMEKLAMANYGEPMPSREWLVALEGLARAVARKNTEEAAAEAMGLQTRALDIGLKLTEMYPSDVVMRRTVAVTLYLTHVLALAAGDGEHADQCLDICHDLLRDSVARGMEFDEPLMELLKQLEAS